MICKNYLVLKWGEHQPTNRLLVKLLSSALALSAAGCWRFMVARI